MKRLRALLVGFALTTPLAVAPASAQVEGGITSAFFRGTSPEILRAGEPFVLNVYSGPCEYLSDVSTAATIESISDGTVTIHVPGTPDIPCSNPTGERQYDLPGIADIGTYRFAVILMATPPGSGGGPIGARDITVVPQGATGGPRPIAIPSTSTTWLALLAIALVFLALVKMGRR
jgi:hypothetical protein